MSKYARIDDGKVAELFETEGDITTMFHPELLWVGVTEDSFPLMGWGYTLENGLHTFNPPPSVIPSVPQKVTMRQARLALHNINKLSAVEAAINALPEPPKTAARIEWDYSSEVHRNKEFTLMMATALGLTDEALDNLFITAAAL